MRFSVSRLVVVVTVSLFLLFYYADSLEKSQPELSVETEKAYDPYRTGTVSRIEVTVSNEGDQTLRPVFMVIASKSNNHIWNSSITRLEPGEERTLNLTPRRDFQKFPVSWPFRVRVNAAEDHLYKGLSDIHIPEPCVPPLNDPDFVDGPYPDFSDPWHPLSDSFNVSYRDQSLIVTTSTRRGRTKLITRQSLRQIPRQLEVRFSEFTENTILDNETGSIIRGGGLILYTGSKSRVWIVHSKNYGNRTVLEPRKREIVIVTPSLNSSIDIGKVLEERGWEAGIPPYLLYVATVSDSEERYRMGLERVNVPGCRPRASPHL